MSGELARDQVQKLGARPVVLPERAKHRARRRRRVLLLHPAHDHAEMAGLDHDAYSGGIEDFEQGIRDLLGEALLDLKAPAEDLDDPGQLAQTKYLPVWNVRDVDFSVEGKEM